MPPLEACGRRQHVAGNDSAGHHTRVATVASRGAGTADVLADGKLPPDPPGPTVTVGITLRAGAHLYDGRLAAALRGLRNGSGPPSRCTTPSCSAGGHLLQPLLLDGGGDGQAFPGNHGVNITDRAVHGPSAQWSFGVLNDLLGTPFAEEKRQGAADVGTFLGLDFDLSEIHTHTWACAFLGSRATRAEGAHLHA